ncbi:hypothetical protein HBP72_01680 [Listeria welshimeri]|nr:hypothetical protein [Listeria welshimeri]
MSIYLKNLTQRAQYLKILQSIGWYKGRKVDIQAFKQEALEKNAPFSEQIRSFLAEYSNLDTTVFIGFESNHSKPCYHYTFIITKEISSYLYKTNDYKEIIRFADEETLCIGMMGYYYPAVCAIGKSGKLYFKHDYDDNVQVFDSILESISHELRHHQDLTCVSTTREI